MHDPTNRRGKPRVRVRFPVTFIGRNTEGRAYAENISVSGALLVDAEPLLLAGGKIRVSFSLFPDSLPIEIDADVVRETEDGFAVKFSDRDPRARGVLRRAVAKALQAAVDDLDAAEEDDDEEDDDEYEEEDEEEDEEEEEEEEEGEEEDD